MSEIINACIYARESSKDSNAPDIERQIEVIKRVINSKEEFNNIHIYKIYKDKGYSGGSWNRPGFTQMVKDIKRNRIKLVFVFDQDRLARDVALFIYFADICVKKKVKVYSINSGYIDLETAGGKFNSTILASAHEFLRRQTGEKVRKVYEMKKQKNKKVFWGRLPITYYIGFEYYRYKKNDDYKDVDKCVEKGEDILKEILIDLASKGLGVIRISKILPDVLKDKGIDITNNLKNISMATIHRFLKKYNIKTAYSA